LPTATIFDRVRVVLVATRNPLNLGAAARAMSNFGFPHLRVVNPYEIAFREARSAMGGAGVLARAQEYGSVADAVADCTLVVGTTGGRHRDLHQPLRRLQEGARLIRKCAGTGSIALLFGSERYGLSNEDLTYCHWLMRIPTVEQSSMNLGQAVAVCLYELARNAKARSTAEKQKPATAGQLERLTGSLFEALLASGYVNLNSELAAKEKIRRLVRRLNLPVDDHELWLGMLRQINWKLRAKAEPSE
jgi:TrmH family RNA methyltransferase